MTTELTPLSVWREALAHHEPRPMDPGDLRNVLVVAAHPDDETLATGGFMQAVHERGGHIELVVATDGEAAYPRLDEAERARLGRTRRAELRASLKAAGLGAVKVHWLGMPDSALDAGDLAESLRPLLAGVEAYLAPWVGDPHPDHAAAGRACAIAAPVDVRGWGYPIWMWARHRPEVLDESWPRAAQYVLTDLEADRKRRAVACFTSQLDAAPDGGPPVLPEPVLRYFDTGRELFFRLPRPTSAPVSRFESLYADGDGDPWDTRTSWYERRKRAVLLACLPRERYRHAAEPGCGLGGLTRELAERCALVHASDFSPRAVLAARTATGRLPGVSVSELTLPDDRAFPPGIDLAVVSEILYYLSAQDIDITTDHLAAALCSGGDLVLAHWRGWPAEAPLDAADAHARVLTDARFETLTEHTDTDFLLHVLRRR